MLLNRDRALGIMGDFGIDALLGTTPPNVAYLSDFSAWTHWFYRLYTRENYLYQTYALLPRDQSAAIIPSTECMPYLAETSPSWIEEVYPFGPAAVGSAPAPHYPPELHRLHRLNTIAMENGSKSPGEAVVKALRDRGITRGVVGVDTVGMQPNQLEHVRRELPSVQFKEAGELFRFIRMIKSPEEIELLRKAAHANRRGLEEVLKVAKPGVTEVDLARAYRAAVSLEGAVPVFCNNPCGPWAVVHWQPRLNVLHPGDTVYCDAGCTYQNYHADANVVGVLGEPSARHRELFDAQMEGVVNAMARARPGAKASELLDAYSEGELRSGKVKYSLAFAHALGLEGREIPFVARPFDTAEDDFINISHDVTLEAGMVCNLESVQRKTGIGAVAVEVTVVMTRNGCEFLVPPPKLEALPV